MSDESVKSGKAFPFPGIPTTADGAGTVVWFETHITQGACAYPITSSTTMGGGYQAEVANGKRNLWGEPLAFIEPESEHSAASSCEGFAVAGGRVTNFTSGQGLVLMKEVLYTISGKRLPIVFHIGARALTSHALNVHAGHDDVMAVADCGWGIVFAKNAQNAGDLALIARRAAEDSATPFLNVQDGFLTTHTIENVRLPEPEFMKKYIGPASSKLINLMDPDRPVMSGVVQNQDSYMKGKIAQRAYYDRVPAALERAMQEFYAATGRRYGLIEPYRLEDAEYVTVGMGGLVERAQATVDYLRKTEGLRIGALHVTSFRPFPGPQIVEALKNARAVSVIERMDNPLAESNPLVCEIKAAFASALSGTPPYKKVNSMPEFLSGSGGLGSRDIRSGDFLAVARNMAFGNGSKRYYFTIGIKHELALEVPFDPDVRPDGAFSMRGHSVGGYGSVTTNKVIATIVGESFGLYVQAYPKYGSEKKGLPTTYYLTVAPEPILTHCELEHVDFVPLNDVNAFNLGNPLAGIVPGGMIFIQSDKTEPAEIWAGIPHYAKKSIRQKHLRVYGGDGAMLDIGFQSLSRMLASGMDIKVLILDTQVYSNTGGQSSTGSFMGQDAKMSAHGKEIKGKQEKRKEIGTIAMMHPNTFVAQTTAAHPNHFYKAVMAANEFPGPAIVNTYTTCQPEHGVADDRAMAQAKLAAESRAFPLFIYDPRKGERIKERLSLQGNPNMKDDWYVIPKTGEVVNFITFARSEGRFAKHFDKEGKPSDVLLASQQDRLENWRQLQELAGLR